MRANITDEAYNVGGYTSGAMADRYDVIVVGARCAGSPLAALLARSGLDVAVVEQAKFPRDTLSTHVFEADGIAFLNRLGLTERLRETGAPFINRVVGRQDGFRWVGEWPRQPEDPCAIMCVRRHVLDSILAETAQDSGADIHMGAKVTQLLEDAGRVSGVRVAVDGQPRDLRARLVVGADGRNSSVGRLAGARRYNVTKNQRAGYYAYFEGAEIEPEPAFVFHRWADRLVLGAPCDAGLYLVVLMPDLAELSRFRDDLEAAFMDHARSCEPVAAAIRGAHRVGKFAGTVRWEGFFREASGPGWVLAGDAGHFKDPAAGRGISDAFRQADALAPAIVRGLCGSDEGLDHSMAAWGRWRDRDFAEHYWFATTFGAGGHTPAAIQEFVRMLHEQGKLGMLLDIQNHRIRPPKVITPPRILRATARTVARRKGERVKIVREVAAVVADDVRHRLLNRRPSYARS
jgi:2-polyprenyl-6-methoxyphenol hydroxylase-like FAD-dependent oxidoreductase